MEIITMSQFKINFKIIAHFYFSKIIILKSITIYYSLKKINFIRIVKSLDSINFRDYSKDCFNVNPSEFKKNLFILI